jgi:hypothetical protein
MSEKPNGQPFAIGQRVKRSFRRYGERRCPRCHGTGTIPRHIRPDQTRVGTVVGYGRSYEVDHDDGTREIVQMVRVWTDGTKRKNVTPTFADDWQPDDGGPPT